MWYIVRVVGSMVSAVNDINADVVSAGGPSETRSSGLQLHAEDAPPRSGLSQTYDHSNLLLQEPANDPFCSTTGSSSCSSQSLSLSSSLL